MKKVFFILGGILLVLLLCVGFYYWETYQSQVKLQAEYMQQNKLARGAFDSGNYDAAIANAQDLLSKASNGTQKAQAQLYIASSLASQDQGDNYAQAVAMLQKITDDYSVTPLIRALAVHTIASIIIEKDTAFYTNTVTSAPLNSYLPASGSEVYKMREAFFKLLELSDEIYPTSSTEYEIAGAYYYWRILETSGLSQTDKEKYATLMQKYVSEADSRAAAEQSLYSPGGMLLGQLYRARSLSVSGDILNNLTLEQREDAFKKALAAADMYQQNGLLTSPFASSVAFKIRFYYADFLRANFGDKRTSDIKTILKPFANTAPADPVAILGNLKDRADTNYIKVKALKLGNISPEFKNFLSLMGVKVL